MQDTSLWLPISATSSPISNRKHSDLLLYCTSKMMYGTFPSCYTENEICTWIMWISFSLQKACSKTHCIWSAALPLLLCGMMQKSALSGSTSSNLIAGISPHVRRFSVWAFLKTVTTALHSDFLFTTQKKHPLLTCIALKSLNLCTQTCMGLLHHTCITVRRTTPAPHATQKHVTPYHSPARPDLTPSFAPA